MSLSRTIARRIERAEQYLEILAHKELIPKGTKWCGLFAGRTFSGARRRMKQQGGKK